MRHAEVIIRVRRLANDRALRIGIRAEHSRREIAAGVHISQQNPFPVVLTKDISHILGGGGLSDTTLQIQNSNDFNSKPSLVFLLLPLL